MQVNFLLTFYSFCRFLRHDKDFRCNPTHSKESVEDDFEHLFLEAFACKAIKDKVDARVEDQSQLFKVGKNDDPTRLIVVG